jgi:hypothetical protein
MTLAPGVRVVLLSRAPHLHMEMLESFRRSGAAVEIGTRPAQAAALVRRSPELVLVDLVHGACLSPQVIRMLNRRGSSTLVVALHEGTLDRLAEDATQLVVHGFCRSMDLSGLRQPSPHAMLPASSLVH